MRIRCRESWCNIRGTGLGAVGRTTRGRERAEFRSIQTEEGTWKQQLRGRVKTRTLKTEGCGTPKSKPTARGSPPGQNSDRFRPRWERGSSDFGEESKPAPLKPKGAAPPKSKTTAKASLPACHPPTCLPPAHPPSQNQLLVGSPPARIRIDSGRRGKVEAATSGKNQNPHP